MQDPPNPEPDVPLDADPKPASPPPARRSSRGRRLGFILAITIPIIFACLLAGEGVVRWRMPWLLPTRADHAPASGLPTRNVEVKLRHIKQQQPDYVLIGDSHVETGARPGSWIDYLNETSDKKFLDLAVSGSCPSQYFMLLDRLRAEGHAMPVVMVIYIGNDFVDEGLWESLGEDKSDYLEERGRLLGDPTTPEFWPCLDDRKTVAGWFAAHSALYRAAFFAWSKIRANTSAPQPGQSPEELDRVLTDIMNQRCDKPPHSERIDGRLFFFREHEAQLDERDPLVARGKQRVIDLIRGRGRDESVHYVFALTREEVSADHFGRDVTRAEPFISEMRALCTNVIDPNGAFAAAVPATDLYLPDSHWNFAGGRLMAEQIKRGLGL